MPDAHLWPWNPDSETPDEYIDWQAVRASVIMSARPELIRKLKRNELVKLIDLNMLTMLSLASQEQARAIIEGRQARSVKEKLLPVKERITDDMILEAMEKGLEDAQADGDAPMVAKFTEMLAKHKSLFDPDRDKKGDVTIHVITGVPESISRL